MTFTSRDLHDQIIIATDASDGTYDVDAITEEIIEQYGAVDIDTIDSDQFWAIVGKHATADETVAVRKYQIGDRGQIKPEKN